MKYLLITLIVCLAMIGGYLIGANPVCVLSDTKEIQPIPHQVAIPYLIRAFEVARETHQNMADDPKLRAWLDDKRVYSGSVYDHIEWVRVYNTTIEILEACKS